MGDINAHIGDKYVHRRREHTAGNTNGWDEASKRATVLIRGLREQDVQICNGRTRGSGAATHQMGDSTKEYMIGIVMMTVSEAARHVITEPIGDLGDTEGKWGNWYATETVLDALDLRHRPVLTLVSLGGAQGNGET